MKQMFFELTLKNRKTGQVKVKEVAVLRSRAAMELSTLELEFYKMGYGVTDRKFVRKDY